MAPRGRSRKRDTRMDAALDAMAPYGFPNKLVRRTVDQLLKVYGGSDGWVFIEDSAYTLLIDTLLEKQSTASHQDGLIEDKPGDGHNEASPAGCSNRALLPCSNTETFDDALLTNEADTVSASSETSNNLPLKAVDTVSATSETANQVPIKAVNTVSATSETGNQVPIKAVDTVSADNEPDCKPTGNFGLGEIHATPLACSPPPPTPQTKSSQPVGRLCHQRRRPCHGWISDDDEEEELIQVELPPPPLRITYDN